MYVSLQNEFKTGSPVKHLAARTSDHDTGPTLDLGKTIFLSISFNLIRIMNFRKCSGANGKCRGAEC